MSAIVRATRRTLSWARGEAQLRDRRAEQVAALSAEPAELAGLAVGHVGVVAGAAAVVAVGLPAAGRGDLLADLRARRAGRLALQFPVGDGRDLDVDVDPVQERPAHLAHVFLNLGDRAVAVAPRIVAVAARARIQGGDEHEIRRKSRRGECPGNRHRAIFKRLAEDFERLAVELGQLVEEQDSVVGQGDFAGRGRRAAADQAGVADRMVGARNGRTASSGWPGFSRPTAL